MLLLYHLMLLVNRPFLYRIYSVISVISIVKEPAVPISRKDYTAGEQEFIKNVGYRIQFFRKRAGLSQAQLAEKVEMSVTTIGRLEGSSLFAPSLVALYRIAQALKIKPEQLLKED